MHRPVVFGILNVTPDSFSDGGWYATEDDAVAHAVRLVEDGADFVDVGAESTRPGAERLDVLEERRRAMPVIRELVARGVPVSIDTMNASTALLAVEAGATIVNDVSGGMADPAMANVIAETGVQYIAMHWRGPSATMDANAVYTDVVKDVRAELSARVEVLLRAGVGADKIIIDPGLGFAKTAKHNWQVLRALGELESLGYRVLVGASRKRFLGALLPEGAPMIDRDAPTAITSVLAANAGAWGVRVHDVAGTRAALAVWQAWNGDGNGI